jgi:hypothetical protein
MIPLQGRMAIRPNYTVMVRQTNDQYTGESPPVSAPHLHFF